MDTQKKQLKKWYNWWGIFIIIVAGTIPLMLNWNNGWLFWLGWLIAGLSFILVVVVLYYRWRYWPDHNEVKIFEVGDAIYVDRHKIFEPNPKSISAKKREDYRRCISAWRQYNGELTNEELAFRLHVDKSEIYEALRAWRTGQLDDRPFLRSLSDRLQMRHMSDDTRYIPD